MQEQLLTLKEIYNKYLEKLNHHKVAVRYSDRSWFHSSSAGLCARKHFFSSIQQVEGEPIDDNTRRLFRLGDLVHGDIQDAVRDYADAHGLPILIEKELYLEDLNVRGFIDLALLDRGTLYDIKTCNSWKWTKMFGRAGSGMPDIHQQLQLATYGIWAREEYDVDDLKLVLAYYNKNTSEIREIELMSNEMMAEAEIYWNGIVDLLEPVDEGTEDIDFTTDTPHMGKLNFIKPKIELGTAPVMKWECNEKYCKYFEVCGGGLKMLGNIVIKAYKQCGYIITELLSEVEVDSGWSAVTQQNLGVEANSNKTDCVQRNLYKAGHTQKMYSKRRLDLLSTIRMDALARVVVSNLYYKRGLVMSKPSPPLL